MNGQSQKAASFASLHIKGNPVVLFNSWDAGSTKTIADAGSKAVALGSHGVANAHGFEDGQNISLELVLANARRCVEATELPVSLDFEAGYGERPSDVRESIIKALEAGIIGVNIEDKISGGDGLYPAEEQAERIAAARAGADDFGVPLFINARTDLFKESPIKSHNDAMVDEALEKARLFKEAGADGFFVPLLQDIDLIRRLCDESPLPVNIIWLDGMVAPDALAKAGASRISYGPGPYLKMIDWLHQQATSALTA